jgi:hypothetical protein
MASSGIRPSAHRGLNQPSDKMKKLPFPVIAAACAALAFTGCSKSDRTEVTAKAKDAYQDTKTAVVDAWGDVKSFTFEKKDDFSKSAKALSSKADSQLSELRANYSEDKASASRKAAMAELKDSEADFKEKMSALGTATADTWDSAKQNVIASWDKLQASYYKARAD